MWCTSLFLLFPFPSLILTSSPSSDVGPLGKMIGNPAYGGDMGFELAAAFAGVTFVPFRYLERKYTGR